EQRRHIHVFVVGADRHRVRAAQLRTRGAAVERAGDDAVGAIRRLRQSPGGRIARERDQGVGDGGCDVYARAVAADRHALRGPQGEAGGAAACRYLDDATRSVRRLRQRTAGRVTIEHRDRVTEKRADVDVLAVGADGDDVGADQRTAAGAAGER